MSLKKVVANNQGKCHHAETHPLTSPSLKGRLQFQTILMINSKNQRKNPRGFSFFEGTGANGYLAPWNSLGRVRTFCAPGPFVVLRVELSG